MLTEVSHGGEMWVPVAEAAERLKVDPERIHKRIASKGLGKIEARNLGDDVCVRKADVDHMAKHGLPHPDLEQLETGEKLQVPAEDEWAVAESPMFPLGPCGYVYLISGWVGPTPARFVRPGDIMVRGEEASIGLNTVAQLPLRHGALAIIRQQAARIAELEAHLEGKRS